MEQIHRFSIMVMFLLLLCVGCSSGNQLNPTPEINSQPQPQPQPQPKNVHIEHPPVKPELMHKPLPLSSLPPTKSASRPAIIPNKIYIPSVRIQASVEPVGVLDNGQMEVPESTENVGLLMSGVKPGQRGNAVIAGHVDNYTGPAIFYGLKKLKRDDPVLLSDASGKYLVYKVLSVESFKTVEAPIDRIFGKTDEARLNLITCAGKYNRQKKEHEKRLIVFTRLME